LNPGRQRSRLTKKNGEESIDWVAFPEWLAQENYQKDVASSMFSYAQQFSHCLLKRDLSDVRDLRNSFRPNIMKALSALAKFLGIYEEYRQLIKNYCLKWCGRSAGDLIIDRLTKVENPDEVFEWIRARQRIPSYRKASDDYGVLVVFEPSELDKDFQPALGFNSYCWFPSAKELRLIMEQLDLSDRLTCDWLRRGHGWSSGPRPFSCRKTKVADFM
jgi:hypothetical protein